LCRQRRFFSLMADASQARLDLAKKLLVLAEQRGMKPEDLLKLLDINDSDALAAVLAPPEADKPKYASSHFKNQKQETPEELEAREIADAKRKREERLKEIQDLRAKGILGE